MSDFSDDDASLPLEIGEVPDDESLIRLTAQEALHLFRNESVFNNGFVSDSAREGSPCSVAAVGFALATYVAAEHVGLMGRDESRARCLACVRAMASVPEGDGPLDGRFRGFYYHFLDLEGRRTWQCELSSIDTALLMAGLLVAAGHFDHESADENEIRATARRLYEEVQWPWMLNKQGLLSHGWRPEAVNATRKDHGRDGFITHAWQGYNEGLILLLLALGSPTYPIPAECYDAWLTGYAFTSVYGQEYFHCPPLFVYQFPQGFIDFRGMRDRPCRDHDVDYFEVARRATLAQIAYAEHNPHGHEGYGPLTWGLSASNGPGSRRGQVVQETTFFGYVERGLPPPGGVIDDGTLAPWAVAASLPYLPDETLAGIRAHRDVALCREDWAGFMGSYNLTYVSDTCPHGWYDENDLAIEQGPIVIAAANHTHGSIWEIMRRCDPIRRGLERAGFEGGWLEDRSRS